jgi:5'-hydroxyaverantin dehydrogenase
VNFVHTDVTSWASQVAAFKSAIRFSPSKAAIDVVVAGAGINGKPFLLPKEEPASLSKDPEAPFTNDINVNLIGVTYTAKLASHYFSLPPVATTPISPPTSPISFTSLSNRSWSLAPEWSKVLIVISSSGAYLEIPLQATYNASKWGVRGLFRTIREPLAKEGMRVNLIAPWLVETPMTTKDVVPSFQAVGLPVAPIEDVITAVMHCVVNDGINGRAFIVGPKKIVDLGDDEEGCDGGLVMKNFGRLQLPGYKDKVAKLMKLMGFSYKEDIADVLQAL